MVYFLKNYVLSLN